MSDIDWAAAGEAYRRKENMSRRLDVLVHERGLSETLAGKVYATGDPSLVVQLEAATDDQIAQLNRGVDVALDFEQAMRSVEQTMSATVADLRALAERLDAQTQAIIAPACE